MALKFINPPFTPNIAWEWAECVFNKQPEKCPEYIFKKLEDISPNLRKAVIAAEDQRFLSHNGFDFNEIKNALKTLIKEKKLMVLAPLSFFSLIKVFKAFFISLKSKPLWDKNR